MRPHLDGPLTPAKAKGALGGDIDGMLAEYVVLRDTGLVRLPEPRPKLTDLGVLVQDVAQSLCIHPFMLSKWRKQVRDEVLKGKLAPIDVAAVGELQRLRELEHKYKRLRVEHDILKKAIRFASELKAKSSGSSKQTGKPGQSR